MEIIRGKTSLNMDITELKNRITNYNRIILDLGTGDGKYAFHYAQKFPNHFVIGLDSTRENLNKYSRAKLPNLLYVIANAKSLPLEFNGMISHVTINFPWGSLLKNLLDGDSSFMCGLNSISHQNTSMDIRLNGGGMSEVGIDFETGTVQVQEKMREAGWMVKNSVLMKNCDLQKFPSTWAKRLAFGRDPRAVYINACFKSQPNKTRI